MKKTLQLLLLLFLFVMSTKINAQQDPMYSMYMFDKMLINPAFTGSADWAVGTLKYRSQYSGLEGSPTTQTFNFHSPITKRHIGLGFKVINDEIAIVKNLNASLLYSYHLNFARGKLSVGLETGIVSRKIDYSDLILSTEIDNSIPAGSSSSMVPDASWGLYYQKKQFYAGFSHAHLIKANFNDNTENESQSHLYNHMYFMSGTVFDIAKKISIEPSIFVKLVSAAPIQLDINTMAYYDDRFGIGIQYRTGDAIVALIKINIIEQLRIAYAYDMVISGLSAEAGGGHEIILSYGIKLPPPPSQKEVHPRYYF